jgi:hypothetical protein
MEKGSEIAFSRYSSYKQHSVLRDVENLPANFDSFEKSAPAALSQSKIGIDRALPFRDMAELMQVVISQQKKIIQLENKLVDVEMTCAPQQTLYSVLAEKLALVESKLDKVNSSDSQHAIASKVLALEEEATKTRRMLQLQAEGTGALLSETSEELSRISRSVFNSSVLLEKQVSEAKAMATRGLYSAEVMISAVLAQSGSEGGGSFPAPGLPGLDLQTYAPFLTTTN